MDEKGVVKARVAIPSHLLVGPHKTQPQYFIVFSLKCIVTVLLIQFGN